MGYSTYFDGSLSIEPPLTDKDRLFLEALADTRRMKRALGPEFGVDGEFHVLGESVPSHEDPTVIEVNKPPGSQPSLWCQWRPTDDGKEIMWDEGEKFYEYIEWLVYLIERILKPKGYVLDGEIHWVGEEHEDFGKIIVESNQVYVRNGILEFGLPQPISGHDYQDEPPLPENWMLPKP